MKKTETSEESDEERGKDCRTPLLPWNERNRFFGSSI